MSPEQAEGKRVDQRSDIFSFGLVLYEMVTGRKAFAADSAVSTLSAILRDEPTSVAAIVPGIPAELDRIIHRALRKDPDQRWQSMKEMQAELVALQQKSDSGLLYIAPVAVQTKRSWAGLVIVSIILLAGILGGALWWARRGATRPVSPIQQSSPIPAAPAPPGIPPPAPEKRPSPFASSTLTNQTILDMAQAKVAPTLIIDQIGSSKTNFDLSTAEIIRLTRAGVPAAVIEAMRSSAGATIPPPRARVLRVIDGVPFSISLPEAVPNDPQPGQALRFQVDQDVRVSGAVVIAKGSEVTGEVVTAAKKKLLIRTVKPTFRLVEVTAVDGAKLKIRATPVSRGEYKTERALEPLVPLREKDVLAAAGSEFLAYIDGDQSVTVRQ